MNKTGSPTKTQRFSMYWAHANMAINQRNLPNSRRKMPDPQQSHSHHESISGILPKEIRQH
jgi:hypothetical protein